MKTQVNSNKKDKGDKKKLITDNLLNQPKPNLYCVINQTCKPINPFTDFNSNKFNNFQLITINHFIVF